MYENGCFQCGYESGTSLRDLMLDARSSGWFQRVAIRSRGRTDFPAARLARNGEAEPIQIVETAATFAIEWKGSYRINGPTFVYSDRDTGRVITILGYPTDKLVGVE